MKKDEANKIFQYLTFGIGDEMYALKVIKVKEVLEYQNITRVPKTPDFMLGVINVRGHIVPIIDLHMKFKLPSAERSVDTCFIVLEVPVEEEMITIGIIADQVHSVTEILPENIDPAPKIGTQLDTSFIEGIGKENDRFLIILNIDKLITVEEMNSIAKEENAELATEE